MGIRRNSRLHHRSGPLRHLRLPRLEHPDVHEIQDHRRLRLWLPLAVSRFSLPSAITQPI